MMAVVAYYLSNYHFVGRMKEHGGEISMLVNYFKLIRYLFLDLKIMYNSPFIDYYVSVSIFFNTSAETESIK